MSDKPIFLRIFRGEALITVKQFSEEQVVLGRQEDLQVPLNGERVGLIHAALERRGSDYFLMDLGSETGTFRNRERVLDTRLESGDEIMIGEYRIEFSIGVPRPLVSTSPPPKPEPKPVVSPAPEVKSAPQESPVATAAPAAQEKPAVSFASSAGSERVRPVGGALSSRAAGKKSDKAKNKRTFAPPSKHANIRDFVKPMKGTVVEVVVAWRERLIDVHHFTENRIVFIGSHPENDIVIPVPTSTGVRKLPIVKIENRALALFVQGSKGELIKGQTSSSLAEVAAAGRVTTDGQMQMVPLDQGEMAKIELGDQISVLIRYVPDTPKVALPPLIDLTSTEFAGVVLSLVVVGILSLYMYLYAPGRGFGEEQLEPERVAVFIIQPTPVPTPPPTPVPTPVTVAVPSTPPPVVATPAPTAVPTPRVVRATPAPRPVPKPPAVRPPRATEIASPIKDPGKAADPAPNRNTKGPQQVTSTQQGGAIKSAKTEGAQMQAKTVKPESSGVFSVFGTGGAATQLNESSSGVGELAGTAGLRTGTTGSAVNRPGEGVGSDMKDTGAGGTGRAVVGVRGGIFGEGLGTGTAGSGLGGSGLQKQSTQVQVGGTEESFSGSIDRDAIRRVIQQNLRLIRTCYERELNKNPSLFGKVVLNWDIGVAGRVIRGPSVASNEMGSAPVASCVSNVLKGLKFPEPPPGQEVTITYPFVFSN
jgi:pSer/pThr/pTyr-binding forkhead associated (FHA) protein